MASPTVDVSHGATLTWAVAGFTAEKLDFGGPNITVEDVDISHQGSTAAKEKMPTDLIDNGQLTFSFHFNPDTTPPVGTEDTLTMTWPSGATWVFAGYMQSYTPAAPHLGKMTGDAAITIDGEITITPAA